MKSFARYHLPALLYAGLVLAVSSLRNLPQVESDIPGFDKVAHFLEYALFAWLTFRSMTHIKLLRNRTTAAIVSWVGLIGFAILDEYYQKFIPGRHSDGFDILSDTIGAMVVLFYLWYRSLRRQADSIDQPAQI